MASSSIHKRTAGFEIQTRDVRNPPEALIWPLKNPLTFEKYKPRGLFSEFYGILSVFT